MLNSLISSLMIDLSRSSIFSTSCKDGHEYVLEDQQMEEIIQTIYKDSAFITLKSLAKKFSYSEFYLSSLIKQQADSTFTIILQTIRFQKICFQLLNSSLTVNQIILDNGYTNKSWVTKKFKEYFKMTTTQFRKTYKKVE